MERQSPEPLGPLVARRLTGRPELPLNPLNGVESPRQLAVIDEAWCIGCTLCLDACPTDALIAPYVRDRGYDWEVTINEVPADLWSPDVVLRADFGALPTADSRVVRGARAVASTTCQLSST